MSKTPDELYETAKGIVMFLGRGWEAYKSQNNEVTLKNGPYSVRISTNDYAKNRGKYIFTPQWPYTPSNSVLGAHRMYSPEDREGLTITVSQTKTEQQIALDFERRLENKYIKEFDLCQRQMWTEQDERQNQLNTANRLASLLRATALDCNGDPTSQPTICKHGVWKFSVNHDGSRVERLEIHNIPIEAAEKLFEMLRQKVEK